MEVLVDKITENKQPMVCDLYKKNLLFTLNSMFQYHVTGSIESHSKVSLNALLEKDKFLPEIKSYLKHLQQNLKYKDHTVLEHRTHLLKFQEFLYSNNFKINSLTSSEIFEFVNSTIGYSEQTRYRLLGCLRAFLKYLYNINTISTNLAYFVPTIKLKESKKLPSVYSEKEIQALLETVNLASSTGKRDYTIMLLVTKLGIRASDIANLKFSNILWEKNEISFIQYKTSESLMLPLLPEIGNAIINYIKHGRPESNSNYIFLQARPKFLPLSSGAVTSIFENKRLKGGIFNEIGRKHGPHAYRYSLVNELMDKEIPFPIIKQILGHKKNESTMLYTSINLKQ
jgi:site-specific recombinase XerD